MDTNIDDDIEKPCNRPKVTDIDGHYDWDEWCKAFGDRETMLRENYTRFYSDKRHYMSLIDELRRSSDQKPSLDGDLFSEEDIVDHVIDILCAGDSEDSHSQVDADDSSISFYSSDSCPEEDAEKVPRRENIARGLFHPEAGDWITVKPTEVLFSQNSIRMLFRDGRPILNCISNATAQDELLKGGLRVLRCADGRLMTLSNRRLSLFRVLELTGKLTECRGFLLRNTPTREFQKKYTTECGGRYVEMRKMGYIFGMTKAETTIIVRDELIDTRRKEVGASLSEREYSEVLAVAVHKVKETIASLRREDISFAIPPLGGEAQRKHINERGPPSIDSDDWSDSSEGSYQHPQIPKNSSPRSCGSQDSALATSSQMLESHRGLHRRLSRRDFGSQNSVDSEWRANSEQRGRSPSRSPSVGESSLPNVHTRSSPSVAESSQRWPYFRQQNRKPSRSPSRGLEHARSQNACESRRSRSQNSDGRKSRRSRSQNSGESFAGLQRHSGSKNDDECSPRKMEDPSVEDVSTQKESPRRTLKSPRKIDLCPDDDSTQRQIDPVASPRRTAESPERKIDPESVERKMDPESVERKMDPESPERKMDPSREDDDDDINFDSDTSFEGVP